MKKKIKKFKSNTFASSVPFGPRTKSVAKQIKLAWNMRVTKESKIYTLKEVRAGYVCRDIPYTAPDHRTWCLVSTGDLCGYDISGKNVIRTWLKPCLDPVGEEQDLYMRLHLDSQGLDVLDEFLVWPRKYVTTGPLLILSSNRSSQIIPDGASMRDAVQNTEYMWQ